MPTSLHHPQARFDPIPLDLDLHALVDRTPNFEWVLRISAAQIQNLSPREFEKLVHLHVITAGKPLVISGWNEVLPSHLFSAEWLEVTYDKKQEIIRDINAQSDIPMTIGHYLRSMKQLTNQWNANNFRDERRQRLYLKDIDCPVEWYDHLKKVIPPSLFYLNDNVNYHGGTKNQPTGILGDNSEDLAAPAGDLMSSLPEEMRAQNLMCYIGHEGTYTPAHREMCASLGQNIMVETSDDKNGEKPGSSIWFMTESKDREVVREYFLSMLGHDIEIEKHFAQINAWKKATFPVYVVEQRAGDFILIPPLAPHQVWNRGTRTMKVAWNRTTVETLDLALHEALPKARLVCRDEQYKNKGVVYFTLQKYYQKLVAMDENDEISILGFGQDIKRKPVKVKGLERDFKRLFALFTEFLIDEMFIYQQKDVEFIEFDSFVTCSYCRCNIFNRFLTCKSCVRTLDSGEEDAYDVCMECYAMGRSCACMSGLQWCEQWRWSKLVNTYETWRAMVIKIDGCADFETSPHPLEVSRKRMRKKPVAQICQEALRKRPWKDITKPQKREKTPSDSEPEVDDNGYVKKKKKKQRRKTGDVRRCHVCSHKDFTYRVSECTNCNLAYCFGVLYRAFDLMPQTVLEDENWKCPKCLRICNCGACRREGNTNPYTPKNTLLGHDTRPIADDRSVESLVDFRLHNLSWLKNAGEQARSKDSKRMRRLRKQADVAKAQEQSLHQEAEQAIANASNDASNGKMNGYGGQSHVIGERSMANYVPNGIENHADEQPVDHPPMDGNNPLALRHLSLRQEDNQSAYPDPLLLSNQRMPGMGYYEDNSPDRILFDQYQMPSAEVMQLDAELGVPEFVKKTSRAAKRNAQQEENDDPDFASESHNKKARMGYDLDITNMDPALFGNDEPAAEPASAGEYADEDAAAAAQLARENGEQEERLANREVPNNQRAPIFETNSPFLRHAMPTASHVEVGEQIVDDVSHFVLAKPAAGKTDMTSMIPIDLADEAKEAVESVRSSSRSLGDDLGVPLTTGPAEKRRQSRYFEDPVPATPIEPTGKENYTGTWRFMSMAERMALKGKKFKIGKKKDSDGPSKLADPAPTMNSFGAMKSQEQNGVTV